jgi:hypothetical protein
MPGVALRPEPPGGGGPGSGAGDAALPGPVPGPRRPVGPQPPLASARPYPPARRPRPAPRRGRRGLVLTVLSLALVGLLAATAGLVVQLLPRSFSAAQKQQITTWEMSKRWRTWAAGEIFPSTVQYQVPASALGGTAGLPLLAHRVGIARQASCRAATDPAVARILAEHGCQAVLRATYDDATQSLAVTVGVAVLPSPAAARSSQEALPGPGRNGPGPGVRAVSFRRTPVTRFGNRQRQLSWDRAAGPYLIFATVGYADGRPRVHQSANVYATAEMVGLEGGLGGWVTTHLGAAPPPPECPGGPAC